MTKKKFKQKFTNKELRDGFVIIANYGDNSIMSSYHCVKRGKFLSSKHSDLGIKADVIIR